MSKPCNQVQKLRQKILQEFNLTWSTTKHKTIFCFSKETHAGQQFFVSQRDETFQVTKRVLLQNIAGTLHLNRSQHGGSQALTPKQKPNRDSQCRRQLMLVPLAVNEVKYFRYQHGWLAGWLASWCVGVRMFFFFAGVHIKFYDHLEPRDDHEGAQLWKKSKVMTTARIRAKERSPKKNRSLRPTRGIEANR